MGQEGVGLAWRIPCDPWPGEILCDGEPGQDQSQNAEEEEEGKGGEAGEEGEGGEGGEGRRVIPGLEKSYVTVNRDKARVRMQKKRKKEKEVIL